MTQNPVIGTSARASVSADVPLAERSPQNGPSWLWNPRVRYPIIATTYIALAFVIIEISRLALAVVWSI